MFKYDTKKSYAMQIVNDFKNDFLNNIVYILIDSVRANVLQGFYFKNVIIFYIVNSFTFSLGVMYLCRLV